MGLANSGPRELIQSGVPARFDRYETVAHIASGGMGGVYVCRLAGRDGFERLFAVKFIHNHLAANESFVRMLRQEARIAARAHHPNVVGIVDVGQHDGVPYVVMDYVEGCTLGDLMRAHQNSRPLGNVIAIVVDALNGLHAAHAMTDAEGKPLGLVHRDVSPQNLLVGLDGSCRIADFGVAKATNAIHETLPGKAKGKPAYMSPEQIADEAVDRRSDVFSMGTVLWNAITGRNLFDSTSPPATMYNVLRREIPAPSQIGFLPPQWLDAICLRALERDPNKRYQTALEFVTELRRQAIARNMLAPTSDVAAWVRSTFGAALERRREVIRQGPASRTVQRVDASSVGRASLAELSSLVDFKDASQSDVLSWRELSEASASASIPSGLSPDYSGEDEIITATRGRGFGTRAVLALIGTGAIAFAVVAVVLLGLPVRGTGPEEEGISSPKGEITPAAVGAADSETKKAQSEDQSAPTNPVKPAPSAAVAAPEPDERDSQVPGSNAEGASDAPPPKRRRTASRRARKKKEPFAPARPKPQKQSKEPRSGLDRRVVDENPYMAD